MLRSYRGRHPRLGPRVLVDSSAQVIGDVEIGEDSSIWMGCVIRGDVNHIRIGARTNIQDLCVIHVQSGGPEGSATIGSDVTVGHGAILHGCTVGDACLVGMGATILDGAVIGDGSLVAAGALVPERAEIPPRTLVAGMPARVVRQLTDGETERLRRAAATYVGLKGHYELDGAEG